MSTPRPDRHLALSLAHEQENARSRIYGSVAEPSEVITRAKEFEAYLDGSAEHKASNKNRIHTAARAAHEAIRTLQIENKEPNVASPWETVGKDIKESCFIGVERVLENPDITNEELHDSWIQTKTEQGWRYGRERSEVEKLHPCMVPYRELPQFQRLKDAMFRNVVKAVLGL